ncbi:MAG: ClpXP protease specificity-enhancing factor [Xanthomonadales bacterium]|jgi:stringent starvation protein B|nr:ClpXP protease specificity-enhancing factor [Xanthomonadales bacterium]
MTSRTPYLLRATYEWITDNQLTPYLVVRADDPRVRVPKQYIKDGHIVLNIAQRSTDMLVIGNDEIRFNARFGGMKFDVAVPVWAVVAIYARENGEGQVFAVEEPDAPSPPPDSPADVGDGAEAPQPARKGRAQLRVVK